MVRTLFTKYRGANQVQLHFGSVKLVLRTVQHKGADHVVMTSQNIGFCLRAF